MLSHCKKSVRARNIISRLLAAIFGGYGMSLSLALMLSLLLPMEKSQAVLAGLMFSFIVYCAAIIWAFAAASAQRAWQGLVIVTLASALIATVAQLTQAFYHPLP